jgi:hypothetical protein
MMTKINRLNSNQQLEKLFRAVIAMVPKYERHLNFIRVAWDGKLWEKIHDSIIQELKFSGNGKGNRYWEWFHEVDPHWRNQRKMHHS